jgi:hypothetical protein
LLIKEAPPADLGSSAINGPAKTECSQDPHAIRRQIDPCPDRGPCRAALDELRVKALPAQRDRGREPRYSSADDQDPLNISHISSFCRSELGRVSARWKQQLFSSAPLRGCDLTD